jgi:hypothetical protein
MLSFCMGMRSFARHPAKTTWRGRWNMLRQLPFDLDIPHWQIWIGPLVGLACAGVTMLVGRSVLRRRRRAQPSGQNKVTDHDPFESGSTSERRTSLRRVGKVIKVLITRTDGEPESVEGMVLDRSMGGLCIALTRSVPLDSLLSVRAAGAPDNTPWVEVTVRRCISKNDRWEVGCQFARTPPWGVLLQFG